MAKDGVSRRGLSARVWAPRSSPPLDERKRQPPRRASERRSPQLTIKEVKAYVTDSGRLASVVTESGIEGNCTLQTRVFHPDWDNTAWVPFAKRALVARARWSGQADQPVHANPSSLWTEPVRLCHRHLPLGHRCKALGLPVHRILGEHKTRVLAYASSQHIRTQTPDPYVEAALKAKAEGFQAFKVNPPPVGADGDSHHRLDMEICRALRKALGDGFLLIHHPWAITRVRGDGGRAALG